MKSVMIFVLWMTLPGYQAFCKGSESTELTVIGWKDDIDVGRKDQPSRALIQDALIGRQACPALARLNLVTKKYEALLLKSLPVVSDGGREWKFSLRAGLRWWNGKAVSQEDFAEFILRTGRELAKGENLPEPQMDAHERDVIKLRWKSAPGVGVYALASQALWRAYPSGPVVNYECVGLFRFDSPKEGEKVALQLNEGYDAKYTRISFLNESPKGPFSHSVRFELLPGSSTKNEDSYKQEIDLPVVTALVWNPNSKEVSLPLVRQALTQAIPRGEIVRTFLGERATLLSGPFLRIHPGYDSSISVIPFNLNEAAQKLTQSGMIQSSPSHPRVNSKGAPIAIRILTLKDQNSELLQKIIGDSYASLGLSVDFSEVKESELGREMDKADGILTQVLLDWPTGELSFFGPQANPSTKNFSFYRPSDKSLESLVASYSSELSFGRFDINNLHKIHRRVSELEPWSIVVGHKACVTFSSTISGISPRLSDNDWFRKILL
jgi:hypothetical protein